MRYGRDYAGPRRRPMRGYDAPFRARPPRHYRALDEMPPWAIRTYDLDYGPRTGGPGMYSGRAGYSDPHRARDVPRRRGYRRPDVWRR